MRRMAWVSVGIVTVLLIVPLHIVSGAPNTETSHPSGRLVRLGLRDGSSTTVRLDGVGCDASICSRVAVNSRTVGNLIVDRTRFDAIASIREIADDSAIVVLRDGRERRVSIAPDNRVLYVRTSDGRTEKIALRQVQSIDFTAKAAQ